MVNRTLPEGWEWSTLGAATNPAQKRVDPQKFPDLLYIGMENVESQTMRLLGTVPGKEMKSAADSFSPDDVLYGRLRPYLNKVYRPDFEGLCSTEFIIFRKVPHIHSKFLQYFLNSWDFMNFANSLNAGDRPRVKFEQLADYPFPLAPLPEQERIVNRIEELFSDLDAGVAALERVRAGVKRYKASVLKAAVEGTLTHASRPSPKGRGGSDGLPEGWRWTTVGEIGDENEQTVLTGPFGSNLGSEDFQENGVPVLTIGCLTERGLNLDKAKYISETKARELEKYRVREGDFLFSRMATVGRAGLVTKQFGGLIFNYHLMRLRLDKSKIDISYFLAYVRGSNTVTNYVRDVNHGATRDGINTKQLLDLPVSLPPLDEQRRIVAEVERRLSVVGEVESTVNAGLARAARLRQAVLRSAFEGRL